MISNKVNLKMVERRKFLLVFSCSFSVNVVKLHATKKECELGERLIYKSAFSVITRNKETSIHAYFISLHCTTLPSVSSSILASKASCYMCLWGNMHRLLNNFHFIVRTPFDTLLFLLHSFVYLWHGLTHAEDQSFMHIKGDKDSVRICDILMFTQYA